MQANTVKIQEVFQSNIVLKIPYFQRSYVWDEGNWERFLSDMLDLPETNDNYFLGSVILKKREQMILVMSSLTLLMVSNA